MQQLTFTSDPAAALAGAVVEIAPSSVSVLTDSNTAIKCLPLVASALPDATVITIGAGDEHKNIDSLQRVWTGLQQNGTTRRSLLVNLGGGMVTDLGGFAAATFKRGIRFINVPTTVLSAVDAAVGGKTGINYGGLKNEVGVFRQADAVVISPAFYTTLPAEQLLSGYGEVLKHALLDSPEATAEALSIEPVNASVAELGAIVEKSVRIKQRIVEADPFEQGLRKALNLGHTAAHAFESLAMERGRHLDHGFAVAVGLVVDCVLSHIEIGFPSAMLHQVAAFVRSNYPAFEIDCKDYPRLIELMSHDKKNSSPDSINFTLLKSPGQPAIDSIVAPATIAVGLDIARDLLGI